MRTRSKLFLGLAAILLALSYTPLENIVNGVFKPLAAISLVLAFISEFLPDYEYRQFDEDHRLRDKLLEGQSVEQAKNPNQPPGTRFEHAR